MAAMDISAGRVRRRRLPAQRRLPSGVRGCGHAERTPGRAPRGILRQRRPALSEASGPMVRRARSAWYLWLGGARLLLSTKKGGFRERDLARDGLVALTVLGEDW